MALCEHYSGFCFPMLGLHPEEVKNDWKEVLAAIRQYIDISHSSLLTPHSSTIIALGEIGLDFYWSREFEEAQLQAFEEQVRWSVELQLPLMIHCRKAQNEMVNILKRPLGRIVLETDAPYMAPVPMRGQRNEPAFVAYVLSKLAEIYGVDEETVSAVTTANVERVFPLIVNKS